MLNKIEANALKKSPESSKTRASRLVAVFQMEKQLCLIAFSPLEAVMCIKYWNNLIF